MSELCLSRVRLRASRGEALSAIAPLLLPKDNGTRAGHAHRIIWLLFQDVPDAQRDFLWRDEGNGRYMILSRRPPNDPHGLFEIDTKAFAPVLAKGDRLRFVLRANPVISSKAALSADERAVARPRGKRVDVVMHVLHSVAKEERRKRRDSVTRQAVADWLARQGAKSGFTLPSPPAVDRYVQIPVERKNGRAAGISVVDMEGIIELSDPAVFLNRIGRGFGSAKAFGNGLMLIRRI